MLLNCAWEAIEHCRLEPSLAAQQPHRGFHRRAGSGRVQLAAAARRHRIFRVRHQPRHAGQSGLLPLQPDGVVGHVLHGLLRRTERPARGDERARVRRLRPGAGGCRHLSRQRQDEQQLQPHGGDQSGGQVPFLRCRGQRLHAFGGIVRFRRQAPGGGRAGRGSDLCGDRGNGGERGRYGGRKRRSGAGPLYQRAHPSCADPVDARGHGSCRPDSLRLRLHRGSRYRNRGRRSHRRQRHRGGLR